MSSMVSKARYGIDGRGPEADEQGHVVHLTGVARLDHETDPGPRLLPHQVLVDGGGEQQRRDGGHGGVGVAVGQDDDVGAESDGDADPATDLLDGVVQGGAPAGGGEEPVDGEGVESGGLAVFVDVEQLGQVVVVDHRVGQDDLPARGRRGVEKIASRARAGTVPRSPAPRGWRPGAGSSPGRRVG